MLVSSCSTLGHPAERRGSLCLPQRPSGIRLYVSWPHGWSPNIVRKAATTECNSRRRVLGLFSVIPSKFSQHFLLFPLFRKTVQRKTAIHSTDISPIPCGGSQSLVPVKPSITPAAEPEDILMSSRPALGVQTATFSGHHPVSRSLSWSHRRRCWIKNTEGIKVTIPVGCGRNICCRSGHQWIER